MIGARDVSTRIKISMEICASIQDVMSKFELEIERLLGLIAIFGRQREIGQTRKAMMRLLITLKKGKEENVK